MPGFRMTGNVLQLKEVGDFTAKTCFEEQNVFQM
jgi:hypothetical protein